MIASGADIASLLGSNIASSPAAIPKKPMNAEQIDAASKDFESMFISQMLEQMFGDSMSGEAFGDSQTSEVYKGLMMDAYGKEIARAGGIGIAPYVKQELLKLQEMQQ